MEEQELDTGVILPEDGVVDLEWAKQQLSRVDLFSSSLLAFGKGSVLFMLKTSLGNDAYSEALRELDFTAETADKYINYLQLRTVLTAIKSKYYVAMSLSASELLPNSEEEALALCDVAIANGWGLTYKGLEKALEATGTLPKKMSSAAISVEAMKKKALNDWLLETFGMSQDDINNASKVSTEGRTEFTEKMANAFDRLGQWKTFYSLIAEVVHKSDNMTALRFLSDFRDAAPLMEEYLESEKAHSSLVTRIAQFENEVYPELAFKEEA